MAALHQQGGLSMTRKAREVTHSEIHPGDVEKWRVSAYGVEAYIDGKWYPAIDCAVRERHQSLFAKSLAEYVVSLLNRLEKI